MVGGQNQNQHQNNILKIQNSKIENQSNLIFPRSETSLVYDNKSLIYIIGGSDSQGRTNACETYDINKNKSIQIAQHLYKGEDHGTCYAYDVIFTFGGYLGSDKDYVCFYDVITNK